jgi:hypothetical protein
VAEASSPAVRDRRAIELTTRRLVVVERSERSPVSGGGEAVAAQLRLLEFRSGEGWFKATSERGGSSGF